MLKSTEATAAKEDKPPPRIWLRVLLGFAVLLLFGACWILFERYRAKSALAKYERELLAKGEKLTYEELVAPVPEGENGALDFIRLAKALRPGSTLTLRAPPSMKLVAPGKAMNIAKETSWPDSRKTFTWKEAEADIDQNAETLAELRQVVRSPVLRSGINYRGFSTPLPHLASSKSAAQWLSASALFNLHRSDVDSAIHDIESTLLITRLSSEEPFLISQLVRIAIASIAVQNCWPLLQSDSVTDAQLTRLQKLAGNIELASAMTHAFRGERVMGRDGIRMLRSADTDFQKVFDNFPSADDEQASAMEKLPYNEEIRGVVRTAIIIPMWRFLWSYEDERHLLEEFENLMAVTSQARAERSPAHVKAVSEQFEKQRGQTWSRLATDLLVGVTAKAPVRAFRFQAQKELAVTAIALKRHHLRHKKYPQTLDELVPEFLAQHPVDWMDGQKLRYRLEGNSFVLWSVGDNGIDDGGKPDETETYQFHSGPDIVWPQRASEVEVEAYKQKQTSRR